MWLKYRLLLIFLFLISASALAQTPTEIDSFFDVSYAAYRNHDFKTATNNSFEINKLAKKVKYEQGEVRSLMLIAECLMFQAEYRKALEYVSKVESHKEYLLSNPYDHWIVKRTAYECYDYIGLKEIVKRLYYEAVSIIKREQDEQKRNLAIFNMYTTAEDVFFDKPDTVLMFLHNALGLMKNEIFKKHQKEHFKVNLGGIYMKLGMFYSKLAVNQDSALYYYNLATEALQHNEQHLYQARVYEGYGLNYEMAKDYKLAIVYSIRALEIYKRINVRDEILKVYKTLARLYGKAGETDNEKKYMNLSDELNHQIEKSKVDGMDFSIVNLVNQKENELKKAQSQNLVVIIAILLVLVVISILGYAYLKKIKQNEQIVISEKEQKIVEKEQETNELKQKLNESFAEIITLAKDNHLNFYTRFQEVYPELHQKLQQIAPDLSSSDLLLCAYIYLDFSTKDIAEYTFKSVRTIQWRKSEIRKKLNIPSTDNIYLWMRQL